MSLSLTDTTLNILRKTDIEPQIVLQIDGVDQLYTGGRIQSIIRIGMEGLLIDGSWNIGDQIERDDQSDLISLDGSTTQIQQQLNPEKGAVSSVSSMKIALVDKDEEITRLISPGEVVTDLLGRRCRVWLGFAGISWPEDYVPIFRGIIDDIESDQGLISLNIAHPDQKKRNTIFARAQTELDGAIDDNDTTLTVTTTEDFLSPVNGPSGANDTSLKFYVQIDEEIIRYTGKTGTTFTGCTRAQFGTIAAAHDDDAEVVSFYVLEGNGVDLALKLMLSGWNGPFEENLQISNFVRVTDTETVDNSIFFANVNLQERYGINVGDYITTTGATNGANNVTLKPILDIVVEDIGTYIIVDGVTFVEELATAGVCDFRSQYDTLGEGLKMHGDEVDVEGHLFWQTRFLSGFDYRFYLKDTMEGKKFIEEQIYLPMAAYALPRKSRSSMGYHSTPLPSDTVLIINDQNCTNASKLKLRRSIGKNFYNTIIYRFEQDVLEDKYFYGHIETSAASKSQIPVGNKTLTITAQGMRRDLFGSTLAATACDRLLTRYEFAAEYIDNLEVLFSDGFNIEVGDVVLVDGTNLNISDTLNATRGSVPRYFEVINKRLNIKTGNISFSLISTGYSTSARYGLISPASKVHFGTSQTVFNIKPSFGEKYGTNEWRKWERYVGESVRVRNSDFSVVGDAVIEAVTANQITVATALGFVPAEDYIMELSHYNSHGDIIKLLYTFMTDDATFDDGMDQYQMI